MELIDFATNQVNVLTPDKFSMLIEQRVQDGLSYLESLMEFCEKYDLDYIAVKKLLTPNILYSLKKEAIDLNLIKTDCKKPSKSLL